MLSNLTNLVIIQYICLRKREIVPSLKHTIPYSGHTRAVEVNKNIVSYYMYSTLYTLLHYLLYMFTFICTVLFFNSIKIHFKCFEDILMHDEYLYVFVTRLSVKN